MTGGQWLSRDGPRARTWNFQVSLQIQCFRPGGSNQPLFVWRMSVYLGFKKGRVQNSKRAILCMRPVNKRAMCHGGLNQLIFSLMCQSVVHLLHFGFYKKQSFSSFSADTVFSSRWFQSTAVCMKNECLYWSVLLCGITIHLLLFLPKTTKAGKKDAWLKC
jgi:hypothetical protein